jgi:hypothetical protein
MRHARGWAADGLRSTSIFTFFIIEAYTHIISAIEPLLDADQNYARATEVKALVGELQSQLAGCTYLFCLSRFSLAYTINSPSRE